MREFHFRLNISAQEFVAYYQGAAKQVVAMSFEGARVQFPASALRPFVTHSGVSGTFVLRIGDDNKLHSLERAPG